MELNEKLAEFLGIVLGDGYIMYSQTSSRKDYYIDISGSFLEDFDYHSNHISKMFFSLFGCNFKTRINRKDEISSRKYSKKITELLISFGISPGSKDKSNIPNCILNSNKVNKLSFVRGLIDTDGSLMFKNKNKKLRNYPVIKFSSKSYLLSSGIANILRGCGFKFGEIVKDVDFDKRHDTRSIRYCIFINGKNNLEKWVSLIGFNNPRHSTKYQIYKKFGYCPKKTTLDERKLMLNKSIS